MRQLRNILRLRLQGELTIRQISDSLRISVGAVQKISSKAVKFELSWEKIESLDDEELSRQFYPEADNRKSTKLQIPDWLNIR